MLSRGVILLLVWIALATQTTPLGAADSSPPGRVATQKVLRVAFTSAEAGFDPAQIGDDTSLVLCSHMFEGLYGYDYLARTPTLRPVVAAAMPEVSADFRTWTVRLRPGILFADDPAFGGVPRELVAADFVYSIKRFADPALNSPMWSLIQSAGFRGLAALRETALKRATRFDYDAPIEGVQALDRYTLRFVLDAPRPRFTETLVELTAPGMAREVVERYGPTIMEHPVGTGPFRLAQWRRSSLVTLERNPNFRRLYDGTPAPDDAEGAALLARFGGRSLPLIDRVEASIIEEEQPRWLSFLNGDLDRVVVPSSYRAIAVPNATLAPYLAKRGVHAQSLVTQTSSYLYFNMADPTVGGYEPEKVALRRAIALGIDVAQYIRLINGGQAIVAQSPVAPNLSGYDPAFRSEMGEYSPARARALLDAYGYVDRDGDGFREHPDGRPLVLELANTPDETSRRFGELMLRNMNAIGLRMQVRIAQWPEHLKASRAGRLMMWALGFGSTEPDGLSALGRLYGPGSGAVGFNQSGFRLPAFDALYDRMTALPDGAERDALFLQAKRLAVAYMPEKTLVHRIDWELTQPWLDGYRMQVFRPDWYQMVDVDPAHGSSRGAVPLNPP